MNRLKSVFITAFMMLLVAALGHAGVMLFQRGPNAVAWLGVALAATANLGFFVWLFTSDSARTSERLSPLLAATAAGGLLTVWGVVGSPEHAKVLPVLYAGLTVIGCLLYVFWYSQLGRADNLHLKVAAPLPRFELEDVAGATVDSSQFLGKPALLLFFRGNWCPLCMAQIREIAAQYRELDQRGIQVVLISPQPHENTRELAAKFSVPFRFYVDRDNRAAEKLGILARNGLPAGLQAQGYDSDTVFPTVVMTDASGTIVFADLTDNYRLRPEPETFLRVADQLSR
ncbi:peroxiredoxin-like family protein [Burkholderia pyrrocinia]|uniref:peroxiredoxin family protein n=1 Tax=Burkholderia pyrrocinia TaxID=60550 RepID=UPI002AB1EFFB|nr:peroxiredoxin-like family protein [Burkholderia pyrrocinia]